MQSVVLVDKNKERNHKRVLDWAFRELYNGNISLSEQHDRVELIEKESAEQIIATRLALPRDHGRFAGYKSLINRSIKNMAYKQVWNGVETDEKLGVIQNVIDAEKRSILYNYVGRIVTLAIPTIESRFA